jgi:nicotinamide-nucleotide amidase
MLFSTELLIHSEFVLEQYRARKRRIVTAESCTGGLVIACLTEIAGSSEVVERGFVAYSNEAKVDVLGVSSPLIQRAGAVSAEVAEAMAEGALKRSRADVALAVTGIAGPGGATPGKPVGLVFLAVASRGRPVRHERHVFAGDRTAVRLASIRAALDLLAGQVD